jgi:N-acetyl-gamma-glutamyl-phosphate reductase
MKPKIFVDGQEGTTGLKIHEYLAARHDVDVLKIDPDKRKDPAERKKLLNAADVVFLCLPDVASKEAMTLIDNPDTRVIDASTAVRTDSTWAYGLPELHKGQRDKIKSARGVANPGCHATAFLLAVAPLVQHGIIPPAAPVTCFSLTGYSGGGKKMIAAYEDPHANPKLKGPRPYGLKFQHKHRPEMHKHAWVTTPPLFTPVVCNVHSGLAVGVFLPAPTFTRAIAPEPIHQTFALHYAGEKFIRVMPFDPEAVEGLDDGYFDITACNNTNRAELFVFGNAQQMSVICRLDNLGKGASGAAIQSLNLMLGVDESTGLTVG